MDYDVIKISRVEARKVLEDIKKINLSKLNEMQLMELRKIERVLDKESERVAQILLSRKGEGSIEDEKWKENLEEAKIIIDMNIKKYYEWLEEVKQSISNNRIDAMENIVNRNSDKRAKFMSQINVPQEQLQQRQTIRTEIDKTNREKVDIKGRKTKRGKNKRKLTKKQISIRRIGKLIATGIIVGGGIAFAVTNANAQTADMKKGLIDTINASSDKRYLEDKFNISQLDEFLQLEARIDEISNGSDIHVTDENFIEDANKLSSVMKNTVLDKLKEAKGYNIDEGDIKVDNKKEQGESNKIYDTKEGEIYINDQITNVPEDLEKAIIGVWGETDIEKPVVPIEKTIEDVLSDEMTKQEGYTEIAEYLDITRTIMAEKYRTDLGEIKIDSTRSKEISELVNSEKEKAEKLKESNEIER